LALQHAFSCGVDFTMCNGTAVYFHQRFEQPVITASAIAFLYGVSALFARGLGGYLSDTMSERLSLRGRLIAQFLCMLIQGLLNVWFSRTELLAPSVCIMVAFSIFVQVSFLPLFFDLL
jgi:NNP family nitrate/nitrite transporter-like MFS transporter